MIRSIRFTLTLWYAGIFAVILCLFGWALHRNVAMSQARDVDKALALRAVAVANAIHSFWEARAGEPGAAPGNWQAAPSASLNEEVATGRFPALVTQWAQQTGNLETGRPSGILDQNGRILAASSNFAQLPQPFMERALADARQQQRSVYHTVQLPEERIRLVSRPVVEGDHTICFIQAAASLAEADASLKRLRLWLFWLIPFTVAVTSAVGWLLVHQALGPVGQMVTQAQRISAERLERRVNVPRTGDELEWLGTTFNEMLARLERAFRRLRQFSAAASHELRTPLTVMQGELEVALRKPREPEEYREVLRTHLRTIEEMAHTVEELLMLARSEAAGDALEWRPVNLGQLAAQTAEQLGIVAKQKRVRLVVRASEPVWVGGERRLLERVVANLLDNAIRHTPAKGAVTVGAERRGHEACLIVQDTGPGIPPEELSGIFERFFKPLSSTNGSHSTGLGLGLCRWIAEAHDGRIEAASSPGEGATFTVWLPAIRPPT